MILIYLTKWDKYGDSYILKIDTQQKIYSRKRKRTFTNGKDVIQVSKAKIRKIIDELKTEGYTRKEDWQWNR